jgi:prepilin-type processing-associated H-X9-DG protein
MLALALGLLALPTCGATAPFALLLGYVALRRVNLSDGQLPGGRAARAALILGAGGVVLLFVGLFVVSLGRLRGKSELTVCTNNLRRIGQAIDLYYDARAPRHFPPGTIRNPNLPPDQRLSWMVAILPYMETEPTPVPMTAKAPAAFHKGEALFASFDITKGWQAEQNWKLMGERVTWFHCPDAADTAVTQYVGLGGLGLDSPTLPKTDPRAGFFGYDRLIDRADVKRGLAETISVTERAVGVGPWGAGGPPTVVGVDPDKPFVPTQFGGLHPGGANTLFGDGHVTFIAEGADPRIWLDQCRINVDY